MLVSRGVAGCPRRDSLWKSKPRKCREMESMEAMKLLPPFPLSLEIPSGFPHSRRFDGGSVLRIQNASMRARKSGHIVNISSIGGLVSFGATGYYHATKYAVEGQSESPAIKTAPLGIKVMIVEPGPFRTDWSGRSLQESKTVIDDYDETAGARRRASKANSGKQVGDPVRGPRRSLTRSRRRIRRFAWCLASLGLTWSTRSSSRLRRNWIPGVRPPLVRISRKPKIKLPSKARLVSHKHHSLHDRRVVFSFGIPASLKRRFRPERLRQRVAGQRSCRKH